MIAAGLHALEAELEIELPKFDALGGWQSPDFQTMANWLTIRTGHTLVDAQRFCRVADRSERIPTLMGVARTGQVGIGVLDVAARISTPENESRVAHIRPSPSGTPPAPHTASSGPVTVRIAPARDHPTCSRNFRWSRLRPTRRRASGPTLPGPPHMARSSPATPSTPTSTLS